MAKALNKLLNSTVAAGWYDIPQVILWDTCIIFKLYLLIILLIRGTLLQGRYLGSRESASIYKWF